MGGNQGDLFCVTAACYTFNCHLDSENFDTRSFMSGVLPVIHVAAL